MRDQAHPFREGCERKLEPGQHIPGASELVAGYS